MLWKKDVLPFSDYTVSSGKRLVSLTANTDEEYIVKLQFYIKEEAENQKYLFTLKDAKNSEALQLAQVENAHRTGEKAIIIFLVNNDSAPGLLRAADNMKVVFVDRVPTDLSILNPNSVLVGSDDRISGKLQGAWLANYFKERGKNEIRYIMLAGTPTVLSAKQHTEGALQALADSGIKAIEATPIIVANYDRRQAMTKILPILKSGIKFDAIIASNDDMALGAIEAMESLNLDPAKKVIIGINSTEPGIRAILLGKMTMTVFQNAKAQASTAVKVFINMLNGNPIDQGTGYQVSPDNPYVIWIPFEIVTRYHIPENLYY